MSIICWQGVKKQKERGGGESYHEVGHYNKHFTIEYYFNVDTNINYIFNSQLLRYFCLNCQPSHMNHYYIGFYCLSIPFILTYNTLANSGRNICIPRVGNDNYILPLNQTVSLCYVIKWRLLAYAKQFLFVVDINNHGTTAACLLSYVYVRLVIMRSIDLSLLPSRISQLALLLTSSVGYTCTYCRHVYPKRIRCPLLTR